MAKMIPITITVRPLNASPAKKKPLAIGTPHTTKPLAIGTPNGAKKPLNVASTPSSLLVNMNGPIGLYKIDPNATFGVDETEAIVEIIKLTVNCSRVEAATVAEALAMSTQLFKVETVSAQEVISFALDYQRVLSDTVATPESMQLAVSTVMAETISAQEVISLVFAYPRVFSDTMTAPDSVHFTVSNEMVEPISVQEVISLVFAYQRVIPDTITAPENMHFNASKVAADISTLSDSGSLFLNNYHPQDYVDIGYVGILTTF